MFNLRKHSFTEDGSHLPLEVQDIVKDSLDSTKEQFNTNKKPVSNETSGQQLEGLTDTQKNLTTQYNEKILLDALTPIILQFNQRLSAAGLPPTNILNQIKELPEYQRLSAIPSEDLAKQINIAFHGVGGIPNEMMSDYDVFIQNIKKMLDTEYALKQRLKGTNTVGRVPVIPGKGASTFNFQRYREAQSIPVSSRFPVTDVGDFIEKFLRDLMAWNGQQEERDAISGRALEEIRSAVGQGFEEEANSALKTVQRMEPDQADQAAEILAQIYEKWLSPMVKKESEKQAMTDKIEGIVKFNLSDYILNNETGLVKTASANQSQEYSLYGPTEKRICPKLRGRNSIGGDVVSEYICRHHCNMGIVIDDNKTICGEAVWRANVMDKFSRDYVNEDGEIVGGYLNKRFEINRNVPEENKMRLKPGETRKPRPVEIFGNLEARLQDMRNREGRDRGYRPETDSTKTFDWNKDVDQNNVEVEQAERDRREESSGHKLVQYINKDEQENNPKLPKKSFNLKNHKESYKTASTEHISYALRDTLFREMQTRGKIDLSNPPETLRGLDPHELEMMAHKLVEEQLAEWGPSGTLKPKRQSFIGWPNRAFNLKHHKTASESKKKRLATGTIEQFRDIHNLVRDTVKNPFSINDNVRRFIYQQQLRENHKNWIQLAYDYLRKNPDKRTYYSQPCVICGRKAIDNNFLPYIEPSGKQNGIVCSDCLRRIQQLSPSLGAAPFNLKQQKEANKLIRVVISPKELSPEFLKNFMDEDSVLDFLESLSEHEFCIIKKHRDNPEVLRELYQLVISDLEETSKDLAME